MRCSVFQPDHMIVTRASMEKLSVVFHFIMRSIREYGLCREGYSWAIFRRYAMEEIPHN